MTDGTNIEQDDQIAEAIACSYSVYVDGDNYVAVRTRDKIVIASGNNAHTVFQAAIDVLEVDGGGKIYFEGTLPMGQSLVFTEPRVAIQGAGPYSRLDFSTLPLDQPGLDFSGLRPFLRGGPVLRDFFVHGPAARTGSGVGIKLYCVPAYPTVIIENVRIYHFGVGLHMKGCLCSLVQGCFIANCVEGVHIDECNGTVLIANNVEHCINGIYVTNNQNLLVQGGTVENNHGTGITLYRQANAVTLEGIYFESNALASPSSAYDILLDGELEGYVPTHVIIRSCYHSGLVGGPGPQTDVRVNGCAALTFEANRHIVPAAHRNHIVLGTNGNKVLGNIFMMGGEYATIVNREVYEQIIIDLRSRVTCTFLVSQSAQPTNLTREGQMELWRDTDDGKAYLLAYVNGAVRKVALT